MSLFSRPPMLVVAASALVLPLAAGTASAAFDVRGDGAASTPQPSVSVEGSGSPSEGTGSVEAPSGSGALKATRDEVRAQACGTDAKPCASLRGTGLPTLTEQERQDAARLAADASAAASADDGVRAQGSIRADSERLGGEKLGGSLEASTDGASLSADTPLGDGAASFETDSIDIYVR